ncbi:MAG: NUDIX hydrolase [Vulcanimicrobiaceae bacterium]
MDSMRRVRPAATVMLLRDAPRGIELFMLRRSARSAFVPDAYVFPGGALDARDSEPATLGRMVGLDAARIRAEFRAEVPAALPTDVPAPGEDQAAGLYVAALRELFEEAGVLLACDAGGSGLRVTTSPQRIGELREGLHADALTFKQVLAAFDAYGDARALTLFSHWITPPNEARRFDTWFFLAAAPSAQNALADAGETHDGLWIAPAQALARHAQGQFHLVYPTVKHLERLTGFADMASLIAYAAGKPIVTIAPDTSPDVGFVLPVELEGRW